VIGMGRVLNVTAASLLTFMVLGLALLARSRRFPRRLAAWKPQAVLTGVVFVLGFGLLWLLSMEPVAALQRAAPSDRSNIVLITLDTTRADRMSVYGHQHRTTPRLEAFASRATLYRHAYANSDMTLSSHGSLFTGLYPTLHGAHLDGSQSFAIAATVPTLAELLRKAGYRNYASVANYGYLDPIYGFARGFDEWWMPRPRAILSPFRPSTYLLRMGVYKLALPWLWTEAMRLFVPASELASAGETLITEADGQPFFLFLNFMESHRPWVSSGEFRTLFPDYEQTFDEIAVRSFQPEVEAGRRAVTVPEQAKLDAAYDGSLAYLDDVVGGLLERFAAEPWYDKSLIIVTADHGDQLGEKNRLEHANGVDHGVTSIPLIVKFPDQTTGRDVPSPVSQVDVFSTIAAAAGVAVPSARAGVDLGAGDPGDERTLIIESYPYGVLIRRNPKWNRMERAMVRGRWKLITSSGGRRELYDMVSDPIESTDLSASRADVARELEGLLQDWTTSAERQRPATNTPAQDRSLLQRMRALGYVQ
jgi:arylsulfatase A-like enzyme